MRVRVLGWKVFLLSPNSPSLAEKPLRQIEALPRPEPAVMYWSAVKTLNRRTIFVKVQWLFTTVSVVAIGAIDIWTESCVMLPTFHCRYLTVTDAVAVSHYYLFFLPAFVVSKFGGLTRHIRLLFLIVNTTSIGAWVEEIETNRKLNKSKTIICRRGRCHKVAD